MPASKKGHSKEKILKRLVGEDSDIITKAIEKNYLKVSEVFEFALTLDIPERLPFCIAILGLPLPDKKETLERDSYLRAVNNSINYCLRLGESPAATEITYHFFDFAAENIYIAHAGACALARGGDNEKALDLVELAVKHEYEHLDKMKEDLSTLASIKGEPRFIAAFKKREPQMEKEEAKTTTVKIKAESDEMFFGHYKKPKLLEKLKECEGGDFSFWQGLGFHIEYDHYYCCTPLDVITFAATGGDGIHFGFLTDFRAIKDLNKAPIVCVNPAGFDGIKLVAKNLKDFLSIVATIGYAELLEEDYKNENDVLERLQEWNQVEEAAQRRALLIKFLKEKFKIEPMAKVSKYIRDLRRARKKEITIETEDGIGIIHGTEKPSIKAFDYKSTDSVEVKKYLEKASLPERLKFYRDATNCYILSEGYESDIQKIVISALRKDGFEREAKILKVKY